MANTSFWTDLFKKIISIIFKNNFKQKTGNLHVVPHEGDWAIKVENEDKYLGIFATQDEAIEAAKDRAYRKRVSVIIHRKDGGIRDRVNY